MLIILLLLAQIVTIVLVAIVYFNLHFNLLYRNTNIHKYINTRITCPL